MSSPVNYTLRGNIGVISIDNPPVNALSLAVRQGIMDALDEAERDASEALLIICEGRTFIAGADISEFDTKRSTAAQKDEYGKTAGRANLLPEFGTPPGSALRTADSP